MATCSLTLHPYGKQPFSVGLLETDSKKGSTEQLLTNTTDVCVFSDLSYEFTLSYGETGSVRNIDVYINDVHEPSVYDNGRILFPNKSTSDRRIFMDCYGFVEITLVVYDTDDMEHQYSTEYIPVLVRRGELNNAVKAMVNYVYSNQESLLFNGEPKAKNIGNLKESGYQTLAAQIPDS